MSKTIAVTNQKGGVGKTTTSVNLAAALAATNKDTLLIDLDPQGNATMGSGINKHELEYSINDLLLQRAEHADIVKTASGHYDIIPANGDLTEAEISLLQSAQKETCLKTVLDPIKAYYDYIIIDCPPTLNMLTVNALTAASSVIIPIQCEYYALEGLSDLLSTIDGIIQSCNSELKIEGLLRTMYDSRNRLSLDVSEELLTHFDRDVFNTVIPRNVRLAEAPSHGLSVLQYEPKSQGALAYLTLAGEVIRRQ